MQALVRLGRRVAGKLRYKLLALVLAPILLAASVALMLAVDWGRQFGYDQLFLKVRTDLAVAHDAFMRIESDYLESAGRLAESFALRDELDRGDLAAVVRRVDALRERAGFSFLHLIDAQRRWRDATGAIGTSRHSDLVTQALRGRPAAGVEIFSSEELGLEALAEAVRMPLLATQRAAPSERQVEDRGMVMRVAYPVFGVDGVVRAVIDGGVLLNGNFRFVDAIRDLVYGPGSLPPDSIGTVTVFLDDVRVSTNVPLGRGERALGTRVSQAVRDLVLRDGETWVDRAFVVNDWYISAYDSIVDVRGERVGMLYAGFLEAPFRGRLWTALWHLGAVFAGLMLLSGLLAWRAARAIYRPVEAISAVAAATRRGEDRRIGAVASKDEIGELAREFDAMLDLLQQRNRQIQVAADELEQKVERRTAELERRNADLSRIIELLQRTRSALVEAEKLAALGQLTAGVAHEINNPLAVILGNVDVVMQELGDRAEPLRGEFALILQQIERIRNIVGQLLQYARPAQYAGDMAEVDVNAQAAGAARLVEHMIRGTAIRLEFELAASHTVRINPQELQQVLVNLLVNAVHALEPKGGLIRIACADWDQRGVRITVSDDGPGIDPAIRDRIFDPFFGTKAPGAGSGLGLSISYGLVRRYGGRLTVESHPGAGAQFTVWLLSEPELREDERMIAEMLAESEPGPK
ncbi:MAG: cache domain-containing protein [Burkholderiales bacterium]|nr:MAG: cache domain-containing protein [Burkholderiales bacterium]